MNPATNYLLITACKNEEDNLPGLIESIVSQTIRPILWVIIDDGSTDNTFQLAKNASQKNNWIKIIQITDQLKRDLGLHLAKITQQGFDFAIEYCFDKGIEYHYLGNVDGDLILEDSFYNKMLKKFQDDLDLGIASGETRYTINGKLIDVKGLPDDEPSGGHMLIKRKCFEDCNGIPYSYSYDSVLKAKARLMGWKTKRFKDILATESRDFGNADGYIKGFLQMGQSSYYLNLHPIHIFARGIMKTFKMPYYGGIIYIIGYLYSVIKRDSQIEDDTIRTYFWNKWKKVYKQRLSTRITYEAVK